MRKSTKKGKESRGEKGGIGVIGGKSGLRGKEENYRCVVENVSALE